MAFSTSPRKVVPLSTGEVDGRPRSHYSSSGTFTKRAFFCGVVVEGPNDGQELSEDVQDLVASLGDRISSDPSRTEAGDVSAATQPLQYPGQAIPQTRKRAMTDSSALADLIDELVSTEQSYVRRIRILKESYADPLRSYARNKDTAIIPAYEAKILFGNIDALIPVNEAFLHDLELMMTPNGTHTVGGVGDVALRHFRELRAFECYKQYYIKREEAQLIFKREMAKKSSTGFAAFVERIKYSTTTDTRNRVGLRELLMDPVQRIPRYTLMFRAMVKHMHPSDPQRTKLIEADEIASKIALAETDDQTKRAAIMYCLGAAIDGFPPGLISNSRRFIDCIDVEDVLSDGPSPVSSSVSMNAPISGSNNLPCTLFLFDDKLLIVKRPHDKSGKALTGLDDLERFTNGAGFPRGGMKKSGMSCKGQIDVMDVVATEVAGADMQIFLENQPQDQSDKWSGRPFRVLSVVHPPAPINQDPIRTEGDKKRFLENLWNVQARYRTKVGQSVVLCAEDKEVESYVGKVTIARTYFNVYQRTPFLKEPKKTKVVVHIDTLGTADPIPMSAPPFLCVRVQPLAGGVCRYTVSSTRASEEEEESVVQTDRVPDRIIDSIHQSGLFKFKTGTLSRPTTPRAIFGLDAISGKLFTSRGGSIKGDPFSGGTLNGSRRSKSSTSRSSTRTDTTIVTASDSLMRSYRSGSTALTSLADEESFVARSLSRSRKFVRRARSKSKSRSPFGSGSEGESEKASPKRYWSGSVSADGELDYSDGEGGDPGMVFDPSALDLQDRLDLARRNSKNQHGELVTSSSMDESIEETIYEEEPPSPIRPASRPAPSYAENDRSSFRSTTPTPTPCSELPRNGRATSQCSRERRPMGPRAASPLPPTPSELPAMDIELALERTLVNMRSTGPVPETPARRTDDRGRGRERNLTVTADRVSPSPMPRSRRQPFESMGNTHVTPRKPDFDGECDVEAPKTPQQQQPLQTQTTGTVEPLSIKKKISRSSRSPATRKSYSRNTTLTRTSPKVGRRTSGSSQIRISQVTKAAMTTIPTKVVAVEANGVKDSSCSKDELSERLLQLAETTREDLESSRRAIKRIKLEVSTLTSKVNCDNESEINIQRIRSPRTPQRGGAAIVNANAVTKEALERMEEMRQMIGRRGADGIPTPRSRPFSMVATPSTPVMNTEPADNTGYGLQTWTKNVDELVNSAERDVTRAASNQEALQTDIKLLAADLKEGYLSLEKTRAELRSTKRQCELVKDLLSDATAENEIMYESFNEELDGMFNDVNLPTDEAWDAMTQDLRETKESRNNLTRENAQLKRRLQEVEMQRDEWGALLRAHGLIP